MSYVPGFERDVFISYARANDHEGWVSAFCRKLKSRLREMEPAVMVFEDTIDVQGNDDLSKILHCVRNSAVLVTVMSRSYLTRPWCLDECREFAAVNARRGVQGRIFIVR